MDTSRFCRPVSGFRRTLKYPVIIFFYMIPKSSQSTLHKGVFSSIVSEFYCFVNGIQIQAYMFPSFDILTLRRLMSYIYMEHPFLMFLDHTQRRSTVGRTPLDE